MIARFLLLILLTSTVLAESVDVYIIGGQSNATGQGYMKNLPPLFKPDERVRIYHSGNHLRSGSSPRTWHPLRQASESPDRFGPELGFGNRMQEHFPNRRIAIIKHAFSGSNLSTQWRPHPAGQQYTTFIETVDAGLTSLREQGDQPLLRGMLWQQGEADAKNEITARAYGENLVNLIGSIRERYQAPNMLFAFGEVFPKADYKDESHPATILRRQQQQVQGNNCSVLATRGALLVKTQGLSLRKDDVNTPHPHDVVHFGTAGTLELGIRFADTIAVALDRQSSTEPEVIKLNETAHITVYRPPPERATKKAIIICPGGGYGGICTHTEGTPIAHHLNERGITGIVLHYRLPKGEHVIPGDDVRHAIKLTRKHATDWNLDSKKIGVWGFSAGGHLAGTAGTLARGDEQPDFQILFYPVISMSDALTHKGSRRNLLGESPDKELLTHYSLEKQVTKQTPPTFILHAASDRAVKPGNSLGYYQALIAHKVPAVLLMFQKGGHGPGAFKQNPSWEQALDDWLLEQ